MKMIMMMSASLYGCFAPISISMCVCVFCNIHTFSKLNFLFKEKFPRHHRKCMAKSFQVEWSCILMLEWNHNNSCRNSCTVHAFNKHRIQPVWESEHFHAIQINPSSFLLCSKLCQTYCVFEVNKPTTLPAAVWQQKYGLHLPLYLLDLLDFEILANDRNTHTLVYQQILLGVDFSLLKSPRIVRL